MKRLLKKWWFWVYIVIPAIWIIGITVYFTCIQTHYKIALQEGVYSNSQDVFYNGQIIEKFEISFSEIDGRTFNAAKDVNVFRAFCDGGKDYAISIVIKFYKMDDYQLQTVFLHDHLQHEVYCLQLSNGNELVPIFLIKLRLVSDTNKTAIAIEVDLNNNKNAKFSKTLSLTLKEGA